MRPIPPHIRDLARAVWEGEPCEYALHDALVEAGFPETARHFALGCIFHRPSMHECAIMQTLLIGKSVYLGGWAYKLIRDELEAT